jgi:DNA 3'-phosphatase
MAYHVFPSTQPRFAEGPVKLALFDLDATLIHSKSGRRWASDGDDVVLVGPVAASLQRYATEGWTVAIVTNQFEWSKNDGPRTKCEAVLNELFAENAWAPWCLVATGKPTEGHYRKPGRGLYDVLLERLRSPTITSVFMCGDAVGPTADRPEYRWSDADAGFAATIRATFRTAEEIIGHAHLLPAGGQELVILTGNMGSGKSTSAQSLVAQGYVHLEQDVLKTPRAVLSATRGMLAEGKSVVVDATHATADSRTPYILLGRELGVAVRIAWHIRDGRPYNALRTEKHVPEVAYAVYSKRFEDPRLDGVPVSLVY